MSITSLSFNSTSSDTISLASRQTINASKLLAPVFDERIYEISSNIHPGIAIDYAAVEHIRLFLENIINEFIEQKVTTVTDVDRVAKKLFGLGLHSVVKDAWDNLSTQIQKHKHFKGYKATIEKQHKLAAYIKEALGCRDLKRDRNRREMDRVAAYIWYACESVAEDILRLTGNYVKNIRNGEQKITFTNLDVALNADRTLMELRNKLKNETTEEAESPGGFGFLSEFDDYVTDETETYQPQSSVSKQTYETIAVEFLRDERIFIRELNRINVFRRKIESVALEENKACIQNLFGNISEIHELALKIERTLEDAIELSDTPCIGMGIWDLAEAYEFDAYKSYIIRDSDSESNENLLATAVIQNSIETLLNDTKFSQIFIAEDNLYNSTLDGQLFKLAVQYVLPQLLSIPLYHIYQYVEYVNKLARLSTNEEDRTDFNNCRSSLNTLRGSIDLLCSEIPDWKTTITSIQDQLSKSEKIYTVRRFHEIQSSIDNFNGSAIGKTCNEVEKVGDLGMVRPSLNFSPEITKIKKWKTERYVYIFDQLILLCKKHKNSLKFKDRIAVHSMDVFDVSDTEGVPYCFRLVSRDKSSLPKSYYFVCRSAEEKRQWMTVLVKVNTKSILDRILDNFEKEEAKRIPLVIPGPEQYRFAEPDSEENISFEDYTSSSGIPVIKNGTVLKLIERLTYHSYTDSKYIQTFLISYRSFCTPNDLLNLLLERFNIPIPNKLQQQQNKGGPLAGRYDTVQSHGLSSNSGYSPLYEQSFQRFRKEYERPVQLRVLSVINQWVKFHWYDFQCDQSLLDALEQFLQKSCDPKEKLTKQHKKFCKTILATIEKRSKTPLSSLYTLDGEKGENHEEGHVNGAFIYGEEQQMPAYANDDNKQNIIFGNKKPETVWHTAPKGDIDTYDLLTLHPLEIGRQLTLLHFDLYRAIKPIELVEAAWTKHDKYRKSPQLLRLTDHSTLLTYWVSRSIVETESLEERLAMFNRALEVMSVFEELHNFTGLVAFFAALTSSCVHRLTWCWDRLDNEKQKCFARFNILCEPRWTEMRKRLQTINPPCIPFFGHYLSNIYFTEQGNSTFVKSPGGPRSSDCISEKSETTNKRVLVSFLKCRKISALIREIQMYQNEPYSLTLEPSIRQFFESINPKSEFKNNETLETYLYQKSLEAQPKGVDSPTTNDVKPKHSPTTLRSPGIKPPKQGNHYSPNHPLTMMSHIHHTTHSTSSNTVPNTPNTPHLLHETKRSFSQQDDGQSQELLSNDKKISQIKNPTLQPLLPPPLLPRGRNIPPNLTSLPPTTVAPMPPAPKSSGFMSTATSPTSLTTTPSSGPAPKLHPRRNPLPMSPLTPSNDKSSHTAFQFPNVYEAPPIPPRPPMSTNSDNLSSPSTSSKENQEHLQVLFDREESHSPTVRLSVPLPPALPPPRGSVVTRLPPPLPPKLTYGSSISPSSSSPTEDPKSPSLFVNLPPDSIPPPLPPKTYRPKGPE